MCMMNEQNENIKEFVNNMPDQPGIYQFFDRKDTIIYIGKAKNLKKRVSSYFTKTQVSSKTRHLIQRIASIKYIVVETEQDALILENNLIKKYKPKYNIQLKDDKTFPWICIKNERFPRVFYTRRVINDRSDYYGPFTSMFLVRTLIELFKKTYKLRTCNYKLSEENVSRGKFKVCLQYHINNCLGPCENLQSEEDYKQGIEEIRTILKGNISSVIGTLKRQRRNYANKLEYEKAHEVNERINVLQKYQAKSTVVSASLRNIDVYSYKKEDNISYINFLKVVNGGVIHSFTLEIKSKVEETDEDLLLSGITEIRQKIFSNAKEIIVPFYPSYELENIKFSVPQRGDKRKLLELSEKNMTYYMLEKRREAIDSKKEKPSDRILKQVQKDLRLKTLPVQIECFDNSNLQGTNPVAACVVFIHAKPAKREYRHYNVKTVEGPDDFASMKEIVYRRYSRQINESKRLPDLIIIDGGKGQLSAALDALEKLSLKGKIPIIGIAKRLEEIYFPHDSTPLYLNKNSESLKLIQQMRDEAHRFAISYHRNIHNRNALYSVLDSIPGVGDKRKRALFDAFLTIDAIKAATQEELGRPFLRLDGN